jgi:hypothetical protein
MPSPQRTRAGREHRQNVPIPRACATNVAVLGRWWLPGLGGWLSEDSWVGCLTRTAKRGLLHADAGGAVRAMNRPPFALLRASWMTSKAGAQAVEGVVVVGALVAWSGNSSTRDQLRVGPAQTRKSKLHRAARDSGGRGWRTAESDIPGRPGWGPVGRAKRGEILRPMNRPLDDVKGGERAQARRAYST